jgi:tRNA(Ile)-lysidine synthase
MLRHPLVDRVVEQLRAARMGLFDIPWLLAASGGRDSTVLAHILRQAEIPFALAHMNYGLRSEESNRDEQFVSSLAKILGVPVYVERVDAMQMKGNRQAICRKLRYQWLENLCDKQAYRGILTAHHAADQAETVLMALLKGRGRRACAGMDFHVGRVYRPLLATSTDEIEEFVREHQIDYEVDSSNQSLHYDRNYVRHVLTPVLTARFPNWQQHLLEWSSVWRLDNHRLEKSAHDVAKQIILEHSPGFMRWSIIDSIQTNIYLEMARRFIPRRHSLIRLGDLLAGAPHRHLTAGEWLITRTKHELIWENVKTDGSDPQDLNSKKAPFQLECSSQGLYHLPTQELLEFRVWAHEQERLKDHEGGDSRWIEAGMHAPCVVRFWQAGDRIRMPDAKGRKKVSDLLNEFGVPTIRRRNTLVLAQGDEILWVLGYRSVSFAGRPEEFPRQAFRLHIPQKQDVPSMTNNDEVRP